MTAVKAIRAYFGDVTMDELKALTREERQELGALACEAMNVEFQPIT